MLSYLDARAHNGAWLLRIEDIDPPREEPGAADAIIACLAAHGFEWDGDVRYQSARHEQHIAAIDTLTDAGLVFYCQCSRRQRIALGNPQHYRGTCRNKGLTQGALRARVDERIINVTDRWQDPISENLSLSCGDFIIRRRDGLIAYQLAVVVDDAIDQITDVVRGFDIYESTARQTYLQQILGLPTPSYAHFPLIMGTDGSKLSKQTGAAALTHDSAASNLVSVLGLLGAQPPAQLHLEPLATIWAWAHAHYGEFALAGRQQL